MYELVLPSVGSPLKIVPLWKARESVMRTTQQTALRPRGISFSPDRTPSPQGPGGFLWDRLCLLLSAEENAPGLPVGAVASMVTGVLVGVALVAALVCFLLLAKTRSDGDFLVPDPGHRHTMGSGPAWTSWVGSVPPMADVVTIGPEV